METSATFKTPVQHSGPQDLILKTRYGVVRVFDATTELTPWVVDEARDSDRAEAALFQRSLEDLLDESIEASAFAQFAVLLPQGQLLAAFGVAPSAFQPGVGVPWMVATRGAERHGRVVLYLARAYVARWLERYPELQNLVSRRNKPALRFLRRLGAEFEDVGGERGLFYRFRIARGGV